MSPEILKNIVPLPLDPVLKTAHRTIRCSSLRPGHWIILASEFEVVPVCVVIQSSTKLRRIEVFTPLSRECEPLVWERLVGALCYGQGVRRRWHAFLPDFLQKKICPFTPPRK